jgi:hypothetical protein
MSDIIGFLRIMAPIWVPSAIISAALSVARCCGGERWPSSSWSTLFS